MHHHHTFDSQPSLHSRLPYNSRRPSLLLSNPFKTQSQSYTCPPLLIWSGAKFSTFEQRLGISEAPPNSRTSSFLLGSSRRNQSPELLTVHVTGERSHDRPAGVRPFFYIFIFTVSRHCLVWFLLLWSVTSLRCNLFSFPYECY